MKAITIWQPWASLIALGEKKIETRSWSTKYRGTLAIHAAASMPKSIKVLLPTFADMLGITKYNGSWLYYLEHSVGSFGKVVATCELIDCFPIVKNDKLNNTAYADAGESQYIITGKEYQFGYYTEGRYAWILKDIKPLAKPVPAKGMQRLWYWNY